jgi:hypothetical protein
MRDMSTKLMTLKFSRIMINKKTNTAKEAKKVLKIVFSPLELNPIGYDKAFLLKLNPLQINISVIS